jgi:preprotein translocase subunit SecA
VITAYVDGATVEGYAEDWDLDALWTALKTLYPVGIEHEPLTHHDADSERDDLTREELLEALLKDAENAYATRESELEEIAGEGAMRQLERNVLLNVIDRKWREHLYEMDYLKEGIGLRAMAQRDPLVEYQREGFQLFQAMTDAIKEETVSFLFQLEVQVQPAEEITIGSSDGAGLDTSVDDPRVQAELEAAAAELAALDDPTSPEAQALDVEAERELEAERRAVASAPSAPAPGRLVGKGLDAPERPANLQYTSPSDDGSTSTSGDASAARKALHGEAGAPESDGRTFPGTPRNAQCPCGSGKKYKLCHGKNEE